MFKHITINKNLLKQQPIMRHSIISSAKVLFTFIALVVLMLFSVQGASFAAVSQVGPQRTVKGRVVDSNGEPVLGAAVMVEGTNNGLLVDDNGNFTISAAEGQYIVVSLIGYVDKRVRVADKREYLIIMEEEATALEDAMVVAFSKQKK